MIPTSLHVPDPRLDLVLERVIDVPPSFVWAAWTQPDLLKQWFTPAPWQTTDAEIDLRPGGRFHTVMRGPDGQEFPNTGCYLEVIENERLSWTGALAPGFRPLAPSALAAFPFVMTAVISIEPAGAGTKYTALVKHGDEDAVARHAAMGFHAGWGKALDQLVALAGTRA